MRGDLVKTVFADSNVLILSLGIFFLHMTMTALFVALPVILVARGFVAAELGSIYAPVMILAFLGMAPMMMAGKTQRPYPLLALCRQFYICRAVGHRPCAQRRGDGDVAVVVFCWLQFHRGHLTVALES